jgi:Na+/H+ antiporter NhaD/arsenite permease-like protein
MILAAVLSYFTTPKPVHESNDFNFGPVREVAILFAGIFATMMPALEWLEKYASQIGLREVSQFYWGSGILSSVLDNAPTYLNFLSAALGLFGTHAPGAEREGVAALLTTHPDYIRAISVGSVFFGAVTYIGNGPNFLVKSIADSARAKTPHFFEYFYRYSLPILVPIFFVIGLLFFPGH